MGLREWLAARSGDASSPAAPAPPGDAEIVGALDRLATMLDEGHAPALVRARVTRVDRLIRAILPRLPDLGVGSADGYAVVATATDYLPGTVGGYLRLPRAWADTRPIENGRSALLVLVDQLDLLAATMERMLDAAVHADAQALVAHGLFLESRFGAPAAGGALDLRAPATPGAAGGTADPAPDVPPAAPRTVLDLEP
ncbi:hypothetical protein [Phycicoccus flavus]|uniref:hypothetical protein n=1 Tax=Phycicoccus flavus TaxID=2502783 RepID=UPI000FEBC4C7|nr:hypothetical protein [Phycicoccus flavus]NHA68888.1 hypothetical protein [Phycicoccus flavus]